MSKAGDPVRLVRAVIYINTISPSTFESIIFFVQLKRKAEIKTDMFIHLSVC